MFRRAEFTPVHARDAVAAGAGALWLQLGIRSAESRKIAEEAGLDYVEDLCTAVVHAQALARSELGQRPELPSIAARSDRAVDQG